MCQVLVTDNLPGNLHAAAVLINQRGLAQHVVTMNHSGGYTVVVYRMTPKERDAARKENIIPKGHA